MNKTMLAAFSISLVLGVLLPTAVGAATVFVDASQGTD